MGLVLAIRGTVSPKFKARVKAERREQGRAGPRRLQTEARPTTRVQVTGGAAALRGARARAGPVPSGALLQPR